MGSGFLCSQQGLPSFQGNMGGHSPFEQLHVQSVWKQAQPAPLTLHSAAVNPFASHLSLTFMMCAAELLRISDFIEHSLTTVSGNRLCRKKNIIKTFLFNLHVSGISNADADKHFYIRSDFT